MWDLDRVISGEFTIVLLFHTTAIGRSILDERVVYYLEATLLIAH